MATIENLDIQVSSSASSAISVLSRLVAAFTSVQTAINRFNVARVVNELDRVSNSANNAASALDRFVNAQNRANSATGGFGGAMVASSMRDIATNANSAAGAIMRYAQAMQIARSSASGSRGMNALPGATETPLEGFVQDAAEAAARAVPQLTAAMDPIYQTFDDVENSASNAGTALLEAGNAASNAGDALNDTGNAASNAGNAIEQASHSAHSFGGALGNTINLSGMLRSAMMGLGRATIGVGAYFGG